MISKKSRIILFFAATIILVSCKENIQNYAAGTNTQKYGSGHRQASMRMAAEIPLDEFNAEQDKRIEAFRRKEKEKLAGETPKAEKTSKENQTTVVPPAEPEVAAYEPIQDEGGSEYGAPAEFTTKYNPRNKNRAHNIALAANKLNGYVIKPGAEFSYNQALGPTNAANGYKIAKIFIDGKDAKSYGGGVCQVSSTIFNAADLGGFEITERHSHSKDVAYVAEDRDAATSYGGVDFKFINNRPYGVKLECTADKGVLTVRIVVA